VRLSDLLSPRRVVIPLPAATLEEGMRILVDACVADGRVGDAVRLDAAIRESWPEDTMSLGPHAWLPHFRTDAVPALVVALGIAPAPIAGGALDGGRDAARELAGPRMILLVVAPPREHVAYLQTVAAGRCHGPSWPGRSSRRGPPTRCSPCRACARSSSKASCSSGT